MDGRALGEEEMTDRVKSEGALNSREKIHACQLALHPRSITAGNVESDDSAPRFWLSRVTQVTNGETRDTRGQ